MLLRPFRLLTREEELEAFRLWREEGCETSRHTLIESQLRYATQLARKYMGKFPRRSNDLNMLDEVEAAAWVSVIRAVDVFDPTRGKRLITLVSWTVRTEIHRRDKGGPIKVPLNASHCLNSPHLEEAYRKAKRTVPIHYEGTDREGSGKETTRLYFRQPTAPPVECELENEESLEVVYRALDTLTDSRERYILQQRLLTSASLEEVAKELGVTRERVRQIEVRAYDRLRRLYKVPTANDKKRQRRKEQKEAEQNALQNAERQNRASEP